MKKSTILILFAFIVLANTGCKTKEVQASELIDSATAYQLKAAAQYTLGTGIEIKLALLHEDTAKIYEAKSKKFIDSAMLYLTPEQIKLLAK